MKYLHKTTEATPSSEIFGPHVWLNTSSNKVSYGFGYNTATISNVIGYGKKIKEFIETYKIENPSVTNTSDFILSQYGRINRYNDSTWAIAGGTIPTELKTELYEHFPYFPLIETIKIPNGDIIDAPHFWAVVNTIMNGFGDLGGWAGDLVEFAAELLKNPSEEFPTTAYAFDREDWNSDADAYNIMKTYSNNLLDDMKAYFLKSLTEKQRINTFITSEDIKTRFNNSPNRNPYLSVLMIKYGVSDITNAATKMQTYLDENK